MIGVSAPLNEVSGQLDSLNRMLLITMYAASALTIIVAIGGIAAMSFAYRFRDRLLSLIARKN